MATQHTARTQYIRAENGTTFAYRRLGKSAGIPLVMHIHFRANMDFWDPSLVNPIAAARPVIIFDQAGVGRSDGEIPTTFQGWADDLIALVSALGLGKIDLFGFSMGGKAVQMVALTAPTLIRRLILAGTSASEPSSLAAAPGGIVWPRDMAPREQIKSLASATTSAEVEEAIAFSFFNPTASGRAAARDYFKRLQTRSVADEPQNLLLVDRTTAKRQLAAAAAFTKANPRDSFDRLGKLKMPVLVLNGDNDTLIPTSRSWELATQIENAQLIIYPRSGHGFLWQYADLVAKHVNMFLDGDGFENGKEVERAKL